MITMVYELSNMPWWQAEEKFKESKLAIVPVGATEQHGLHLGLGADWIQAWTFAKKVGEKTGRVVLPVLPYGMSMHHKEFPGVMTLTEETYTKVIFEILTCLNRYGITHVVFVNGHGGNTPSLINAAKKARDEYGMLCGICDWWTAWEHRKIFGQGFEAHGGYAETSFMLASRPEAVLMEHAVLSPTMQVHDDITLTRAGVGVFKDGYVQIPLRTIDTSITGSMTESSPEDEPGTRDYSMITPEFAEKLMEEYVQWIADFVNAFESFNVPDVKVSKEKAMKDLL